MQRRDKVKDYGIRNGQHVARMYSTPAESKDSCTGHLRGLDSRRQKPNQDESDSQDDRSPRPAPRAEEEARGAEEAAARVRSPCSFAQAREWFDEAMATFKRAAVQKHALFQFRRLTARHGLWLLLLFFPHAHEVLGIRLSGTSSVCSVFCWRSRLPRRRLPVSSCRSIRVVWCACSADRCVSSLSALPVHTAF